MRNSYELVIFVVALLWMPVAIADDWQPLASGPVTLEIDATSLQKHDGLIEARFRFNHATRQQTSKAGHAFRSSIVTIMFNCKERKYAPYKRLEYDGESGTGNEVNRVFLSGDAVKYYEPVPNSMADIMFEQACPPITPANSN